jgi:hypothetical protein
MLWQAEAKNLLDGRIPTGAANDWVSAGLDRSPRFEDCVEKARDRHRCRERATSVR